MPDHLSLSCTGRWLVADLGAPHRLVSWSLNRPGLVEARRVVWREVGAQELSAGLDPARWFAEELSAAGLADAIGMITARRIDSHVARHRQVEEAQADCVVTAGLNNGERVGTRFAPAAAAGTVNILCRASLPLTDAALLEAASLVAQARTVAIVEAGYRRPGQAQSVTGTGTDCIVMAAPIGLAPCAYAGMHTAIGEAIGACVLEATRAAVEGWIAARG